MPNFISSGPKTWSNRFKSPAFWLATGFGSGLMRPAPGTWGSALAAAIAWPLLSGNFAHPVMLLIGLTLLSFAVGIFVADTWEAETGLHDCGMIVIDEFSGMWISLIPLALTWNTVNHPLIWFIGSFLIFRLLDVAKPYPINWLDKNVVGAMGVMIDDVAAGILAAIIIYLTIFIFYI